MSEFSFSNRVVVYLHRVLIRALLIHSRSMYLLSWNWKLNYYIIGKYYTLHSSLHDDCKRSIVPQACFSEHFLQFLVAWSFLTPCAMPCYAIVVFLVSNCCRNSLLENMKLKLPSCFKTGTTIVGVVFKVCINYYCWMVYAVTYCQ